ncbi:unnamed protein product [Boreogadus saida]
MSGERGKTGRPGILVGLGSVSRSRTAGQQLPVGPGPGAPKAGPARLVRAGVRVVTARHVNVLRGDVTPRPAASRTASD